MTLAAPSPELTDPPVQPRPQPHFRPADWALIAVLVGVSAAVFFQARGFGFIRYDDPVYVTQNWDVQRGLTLAGLRYAATAVVSSNWHPLTLLVEMAVVQLFGSGPAPFHLLSAVLHTANVGLLYLFLRTATGCTWRSAIVAALWGWHPLRAESAAWVSELKDVLCGSFWLLTLLAFVEYRRRPTAGRYAAVVVATALALLAKPMAVTLPFVLLLLDYWPLSRAGDRPRVPWGKRVLEQLPLLALCAAVSAIAMVTQSRTGATGSLTLFPWHLRLANAADAYLQYARTSFWPTGLGFFYPHPAVIGRTVSPGRWLAGAAMLIGVTAAVVAVRRRRPYAVVGWLWFVGMLVPVIGLVQIGQAARADRYTYLPSIGLTIAVVWAAADLAVAARPVGLAVGGTAAVAAAAALAVATHGQVGYWRDDLTLASHTNDVTSDNYLVRASMALEALRAGRTPAALELARSAAGLAPAVPEVHHTYAQALEADGQLPAAFAEYEAAIRIDPQFPYTRDDFGRLLVRMGRGEDAIGQFQRALSVDPSLAGAHYDLAVALAAKGRYDDAMPEFRRAIDLNPRLADAHAALADTLRLTGRPADAVDEYRAALAAGGNQPTVEANLVWLVSIDGRSSPADLQSLAAAGQDACDQTGRRQAFPLYADSVLLARLGRFDDAIAVGTEARARATADKQAAMAAAIGKRLDAYRQGLPAAVTPPPAATAPAR